MNSLVSTQKVILLVIFLNLVVGLGEELGSQTSMVLTKDQETLTSYEAQFERNQSITGGVQTLDQLTDNTIGDTKGWGLSIINIMVKGLNPITTLRSDNTVIQAFYVLITFFRSILYVMLILEIYSVIKNRKT